MPPIHEGKIVAGKYRLERTLARGGMGSVWMARHLQLDMLVAIKFMDATAMDSSEARARFEREAKAAAQLQSPHVVHVHDYGMVGPTPYIVMELLQGEDLGARLRREKRLSIMEVSRILTQVGRALKKAHEAGLIHRDLKPANIFIARTDDDEEVVKVLDFGVVKRYGHAATETTQTGIVVGSVHYMSPEQARGSRDLDIRSDVWSLGVLAFRAIVGQHPFPGEQVGDVIVKVCSDPIPKPSDLAPDLGAEVDAFFARALARNPLDRFQSARDFANELALLAGTAPMMATGIWPLAPAARAAPPAAPPPPPQRSRASVIREDEALTPPILPLRSAPPPALPSAPRQLLGSNASIEDAQPKRISDSDIPTEDAAKRPPWLSVSGGTLTDAPRVSDVSAARPSNKNGTKLIAAAALAVTVLVGGWLFSRRNPGQASTPQVPPVPSAEVPPVPSAEAPPVLSAEAASEGPAPVSPPSIIEASEAAPSATPSASSEPSSRPTHTSAPKAPPTPKGPPPTKKINSTLGI